MIYVLTAFLSLLICIVIIRYFKFASNIRSRDLHTKLVPNIGGLAISIPAIILIFILSADVLLTSVLIFFVFLAVVTILGIVDDLYNLTAVTRLIIMMLLGLFLFWPVNELEKILLILFMVYLINAVNFMDGIDLLVSTQTIFIISSLLVFTNYSQVLLNDNTFVALNNYNHILISLLIPLSIFSIFNYPPAKIFLGSSGSYFIGITLFMILSDMIYKGMPIFTPFILFSVILVDTTYVIIARFFEKLLNNIKDTKKSLINSVKDAIFFVIGTPHALHNYQKICKKNKSHGRTSMLLTLYNIVWVLPLSILSFKYHNYGLLFFILTVTPYIISCYYNRVGLEDNNAYI